MPASIFRRKCDPITAADCGSHVRALHGFGTWVVVVVVLLQVTASAWVRWRC